MRTLAVILAAILAAILAGCSYNHYRAGDHQFTRLTVGTNTTASRIVVAVMRNGNRIILVDNLNQNQSEAARSVSEGATGVLTKMLIK